MSTAVRGIVVLGHGSRASFSEANRIIITMADMMKVKLGHDFIEPAILTLESGQQTLAQAVRTLAQRGISDIIVTPMFLASGSHVLHDIPDEIKQIRQSLPGIRIVMSEHIGADPRIAEILCDRIKQTP